MLWEAEIKIILNIHICMAAKSICKAGKVSMRVTTWCFCHLGKSLDDVFLTVVSRGNHWSCSWGDGGCNSPAFRGVCVQQFRYQVTLSFMSCHESFWQIILSLNVYSLPQGSSAQVQNEWFLDLTFSLCNTKCYTELIQKKRKNWGKKQATPNF